MSTTAILRHLAQGPATASDLGKALRLAPGAVRAAIVQLESQRLVQGHRAAGASPDRVFSLTGEGARRAEQQAASSAAVGRMVALSQELGLE